MPSRPLNAELARHLTAGEVKRIIKAARSSGRYGHRDATMILIGYRPAGERNR
jgi:type 1 fimbriae regulatory protein FimB/type 1 fimbriae regulatory protein FimE